MGIVLIAEGTSTVANGRTPASSFVFAFIAIVSGVSVLLGFFMPIGSVLAALFSAAVALSWVPQLSFDLLRPKSAAAFVAVIAVALACLGPGGFSIDSRLFGRREIVIPQSPRPPKP